VSYWDPNADGGVNSIHDYGNGNGGNAMKVQGTGNSEGQDLYLSQSQKSLRVVSQSPTLSQKSKFPDMAGYGLIWFMA